MPNVEIHGLGWRKAVALRKKVFVLFKNKPYVEEMVVTIYRTVVTNYKGDSKPFFRLVNSCQEHSEEIVSGLETLMDTEHGELKSFRLKKGNRKAFAE
ncbi:hypothetical protein KAW43_02895 [Candidatus Parcubacteria bacterium]|nr:hypothetical protein [Candidatus Parcubacteria bacterium]